MKYNHDEYAAIFKALGDETRLEILTMLTKGKTCACRILEAFNCTQPTLAYHMKQLTDCRLVDAQKEGKWVYYSINGKTMQLLGKFIAEVSQAERIDSNG